MGIMGNLDLETQRLAADFMEKQAREAMGVQRGVYDQSRADQMPWVQDGRTSLGDMMRMLQPGYEMQADPGFQFRMAEGQKALERSAAARGGLMSGGFAKSLTKYGQGLASEEFGNRFNRLRDIAGMGLNSAQNLGGLGQNYANSMSSLHGAIGNAKAAGLMGMLDSGRQMQNDFMGLAKLAMGGVPGGGGGGIPTQSYQPNYQPSYGIRQQTPYQYQRPGLGIDYSGLDPRWP